MKLSYALVFASMASSVSAGKTISGKAAAKVLKSARRLDQGEGDQGDDANNQYEFLAKYNLKLVGCKTGETVIDAETGEYEYSAAVFRLCPSENGCDNESVAGCQSGYGDYVVGLNSFVDAYFEDQRDNMQWDDNFQVDRYAECAEYEMEDGDDANDNAYADYQFFIGPTCTEDELDVKLSVFTEETCTQVSDVSFEQISNGWSLPFETGGLVSDYCTDCLDVNDNGEYELREMCTNLYMDASSACETEMEYFSYYGQNVQGCEAIEALLPAAVSNKGKGGKVFGWIVFSLLVIGLAGYIVWWRKKKTASTVPSDGLVA